MSKRVLRLGLIALLFGAVATAVGSETSTARLAMAPPTFEAVGGGNLVADGNPIPWPKTTVSPDADQMATPAALRADGNPIPWPKASAKAKSEAADQPRLVADGNPIPWPK